jgi:AcrR family transcriptional regulator
MTTRLPRGRHSLSRAEVTAAQRDRIITATAEAMSELGYAATPVAEILRRAGVSRETFYELFHSKQDCFIAAHEAALARLVDAVSPVLGEHGAPIMRFDAMLGRYLDAVAANPSLFRLFLIESYAAGPEVARRRAIALQQVVSVLHRLLRPHLDRFACEALMASVITMVTMRLAAGDVAAVRGLRRPLVELVSRWLR